MNELALFSGAGGGILGGTILGWRTICAVEIDPYAASVLVARQNDGILPPFPIWDDVCTFDGRPWRGIVDVVSGGFPCQDISAAGRGAGIDGEKSGLWREMARIIGEVRPRFAFVENSPVLTSRGLGTVLGDLAALGYDAEWCVLGADDAGAPHIRKRIWILAYSRSPDAGGVTGKLESQESTDRQPPQLLFNTGSGSGTSTTGNNNGNFSNTNSVEHQSGSPSKQWPGATQLSTNAASNRRQSWWTEPARQLRKARFANGRNELADPTGERCRETWRLRRKQSSKRISGSGEIMAHTPKQYGAKYRRQAFKLRRRGWWSTEPDVGRVAHGLAARVDRLKAIGNGQVPAVAAMAWKILHDRLNSPKNPQ